MRLTIKKIKGRLVDTSVLQAKSNNSATPANPTMNVHAMARVNNQRRGTSMHTNRVAIQQPRGNN